MLEAFNECAAKTKLRISKISITPENVRIQGSTSRRENTHKVFKAFKGKLMIRDYGYDSKGGRDNFRVTLVPKSS